MTEIPAATLPATVDPVRQEALRQALAYEQRNYGPLNTIGGGRLPFDPEAVIRTARAFEKFLRGNPTD